MQVMSNGKVRRTKDEWREILARWKRSGVAPEEFCRKQDLRLSSFRRWQERLDNDSARMQFVALTPEEPAATTAPPWVLEVTLPNGVQLRFQG